MASKRLNGYWTDKKNVDKEIKGLIAKLGHFPTHEEMRKNKLSRLSKAINLLYGNIASAYREFGYEPKIKPANYWSDKKTVDKELKDLIDKLGHFPTHEEMQDNGFGSLHVVIRRHYGSFAKAREAFGYKPARKDTGYYNDKENVDKEIKGLIAKLGHFPTHEEMRKNKLSRLSKAINLLYGNIASAYREFGYEPTKREDGYFNNKDNVEKEIKKLIKKLGHFPTHEEMRKNKLSRLSKAIIIHYGDNASAYREFGYEPTKREDGYFNNKDNVEKEIKQFIEVHGHFPSQSEACKNGLGSLPDAVKRCYGSVANAKIEFGYDHRGKISYQNELENLLERYAGEQNGK